MPDTALPILLADGSRLDWRDAAYGADVYIGDDFARVTHRLENAPEMEEMLARGDAEWAVELRCPKTLFGRIETSAEPVMDVRWAEDDVDDTLYAIPGLIAVRETEIPTSGLDPLWAGSALLAPAGWWLARGREYRSKTLRQALLAFTEDPDLPDGRMRVAHESGTGTRRFVAYLASDIRSAVETDRSMQIAALIGACAQFPRVFREEEAGEEEDGIVREIRGLLEAAGVPCWDEEGYDAAAAATVIEGFRPPPAEIGEPDDE